MTDWYGEGIIEGRIRKSAEAIVAIMDRYGETLENALAVMKVSDEDREDVLALVKELQASS